ncbi:hypothetical protein Tco_0597119 [Tanacetum coccineum]
MGDTIAQNRTSTLENVHDADMFSWHWTLDGVEVFVELKSLRSSTAELRVTYLRLLQPLLQELPTAITRPKAKGLVIREWSSILYQ